MAVVAATFTTDACAYVSNECCRRANGIRHRLRWITVDAYFANFPSIAVASFGAPART
jgi:hypothetical protein